MQDAVAAPKEWGIKGRNRNGYNLEAQRRGLMGLQLKSLARGPWLPGAGVDQEGRAGCGWFCELDSAATEEGRCCCRVTKDCTGET